MRVNGVGVDAAVARYSSLSPFRQNLVRQVARSARAPEVAAQSLAQPASMQRLLQAPGAHPLLAPLLGPEVRYGAAIHDPAFQLPASTEIAPRPPRPSVYVAHGMHDMMREEWLGWRERNLPLYPALRRAEAALMAVLDLYCQRFPRESERQLLWDLVHRPPGNALQEHAQRQHDDGSELQRRRELVRVWGAGQHLMTSDEAVWLTWQRARDEKAVNLLQWKRAVLEWHMALPAPALPPNLRFLGTLKPHLRSHYGARLTFDMDRAQRVTAVWQGMHDERTHVRITRNDWPFMRAVALAYGARLRQSEVWKQFAAVVDPFYAGDFAPSLENHFFAMLMRSLNDGNRGVMPRQGRQEWLASEVERYTAIKTMLSMRVHALSLGNQYLLDTGPLSFSLDYGEVEQALSAGMPFQDMLLYSGRHYLTHPFPGESAWVAAIRAALLLPNEAAVRTKVARIVLAQNTPESVLAGLRVFLPSYVGTMMGGLSEAQAQQVLREVPLAQRANSTRPISYLDNAGLRYSGWGREQYRVETTARQLQRWLEMKAAIRELESRDASRVDEATAKARSLLRREVFGVVRGGG